MPGLASFQVQAPVDTRFGNAACLFDYTAPAPGRWTSGVQSIFQVASKRPLGSKYTVFGWSVEASGVLVVTAAGPIYGALGKLQAALVIGSAIPPVTDQPFTQPPQSAIENMIELWDGSQDPPFPIANGTGLTNLDSLPPILLSGALQLPQPLPLAPSDQLAVMIWLTPSLLSEAAQPLIYNVQAQIDYSTS